MSISLEDPRKSGQVNALIAVHVCLITEKLRRSLPFHRRASRMQRRLNLDPPLRNDPEETYSSRGDI